jgi:PBP1b-binding outer membrane lipoprotein LpoB
MRKILITALLAGAVLLAGCSAEAQDRKGGSGQKADRITDVDSAEVFRNIDNFPNIERVCVDGVAFAATRSYNDTESVAPNLIRVQEWDGKCGTPR